MIKIEREVTFQSNCEICSSKGVACRKHHLIPQRLINIIPNKNKRKWELQTVIACNKCNNYLHPENHLYAKIEFLENKLEEYGWRKKNE